MAERKGLSRTTLGFAVLAAAIVLLYAHTLPFSFQFDDVVNIVENPSVYIRDLRPSTILKATGQSAITAPNRPFAFYTFALNYYFGGTDPWGYRLVNIAIHILNAFLVFRLAGKLVARAFSAEPSRVALVLVVLLWAVHPVQTNAVVYVVQRMTSLATAFLLGALLVYIRGRDRRSPVWLTASAVLFALGCKTKEIAFVFPFTVVLYECAFTPALRGWVARNRWAVPVASAAGLCLFPLALHLYGAGFSEYSFTWQQRLLTECRVVARYLSLVFFPHPSRLVLDYQFPLSTGLWTPPSTLLSLLLHLLLLAAGAWALVRRPIYGFSLLGFYLHLVIESTVIPLDLLFEHRLYLPSVFLFAGLAALAHEPRVRERLGKPGLRVALASGAAVGVLWGAWTWERLAVWRDPVTMWADVVRKQPDNPRAYGNLGKEYYLRGNLDLARVNLGRALELAPMAPIPLANLGLVEASAGHYARAVDLLQRVARMGFRDPLLFFNLGIVQSQGGMLQDAIRSFSQALELEPRLPGANYLAGEASLRLGRLEEARRYLENELRLYPGHADALALLKSMEGRLR